MSEQNKIDEIKSMHAASTPEWYDYLKHDAYEYITYLLQEIERKDEALRFYENRKNYEQEKCLFDGNENDVYYEAPEIMLDLGQHAREAL